MERKSVDRRLARQIVAKHAAMLLYNGVVKEYKDAKEIAANDLGVKSMPSNYEVAIELKRYAESIEGEHYYERLKSMREEALKIMEALSAFNPRLIGSVWRGILTPRSDIDIEVYTEDVESVYSILKGLLPNVSRPEEVNVPKEARQSTLYRIRAKSMRGYDVEILVKDPANINEPVKCEIFGDLRKGLSLEELSEILKRDPTELRIPKGRVRVG